MGQRSSSKTITAILFAFFERNTWTQRELAERIDVTPRALAKHLKELHVPWRLERQEEHPHVYWSVPKSWFPGGLVYSSAEIVDLIRVVSQAPQSRERKQAITKIMKTLEQETPLRVAPTAIVVEEATEDDQRHRPVVEESIAQKVPLKLGSKEADVSMVDMEGFREAMDKFYASRPPEELLAHLTPEQRLAGLPPEQRLAGLPPEQRLADLDRDHQALALPVEVLRVLPDDYIRSLSPDVQSEIRRRQKR